MTEIRLFLAALKLWRSLGFNTHNPIARFCFKSQNSKVKNSYGEFVVQNYSTIRFYAHKERKNHTVEQLIRTY